MKQVFNQFWLLSLLMIAAGALTFISCGSDDENGGGDVNWGKFDTKLSTPKYEDVSALYQITSSNSNISSIELTASGNYIVINKNQLYAPQQVQQKVKSRFFMSVRKKQATRASNNIIVEGKYTKISDTQFELEGWGIIEVQGSKDNALEIKITRDGQETTLPVTKKTQMDSKENTNFLCRTWNFSTIRMIITMKGSSIYDKEYKMSELKNFGRDMYELARKYNADDMDEDDTLEDYMEEWNDIDDYPTAVIFTKSGSYIVLYRNEGLAISTWTWENYDTGLLRYSWNYDSMYDKDSSGNVKVGSRGEQLQVSESFTDSDSDYEEDYEGDVTMVYYLNEAK